MYRLIIILITALIISGCSAQQSAKAITEANIAPTIVMTDDFGYKVALKEKPKRIMTTNIYFDNILLGVVEPERMVSVSKNMDNSAKAFKNIAATMITNKITNPGLEAVFALQPDLFIVNDLIGADKIHAYRDMGIPVYVAKIPLNVEEVREEIIKLSKLVGEPQRGKNLVAKMDEKLARIEANIPKELQFSKTTVLISTNYTSYGGKGCMYDDICRYAKIRNGVSELGVNSGQNVNKEMIIEINPDFFFLAKPWNKNQKNDERLLHEFLADKSFENLKAVKQKNIALIDEKYIFIGHQNCVWSVQKLAHAVYGDRVAVEPEEFLKGF